MEKQSLRHWAAVGLVALLALAVGAGVSLAQEVKAPEPGVPEIFTLEGEFVRIAYNDDGYVSLGYRLANGSVGQEWMRLEIGVTSFSKEQTLKREAFSLQTADSQRIPLATQQEYSDGNLAALDMRASVIKDSINYFPAKATRACRIGFFTDANDTRGMAFDQFDAGPQRACIGRVYFHVPGGIKHGQHWLNVKFANSMLRVPFRILTKEEEKEFSKSWKDIKKEHEKAFKK
jgi:hypothetical protein